MKEFIFEYDEKIEESEKVQIYICENYLEDVDFEMYIGYGDDIMNGFNVMNDEMLKDEKLLELLSKCQMFEE